MNVKRLSVPIFVVSVFVLCTSVSAVGAADCTCGDICVSTTGWWRAGGTFNASETPIQAAVDFAAEGDTICVKNGTYTENVLVDKRLSLRGEGAVTVNAVSSGEHVFNVAVDYVNISGFSVTGATGGWNAGICLNAVNRCNISGNNASNNRNGIYLKSSSNCTLRSNTASGNGRGIYLDSSGNNNIMNNTVDSNNYGIYLYSSSSNNITGNVASGNGDGIRFMHSRHNNITCNIVSDNNYYGIYLSHSNNTHNIITGNTANSNGGYGIRLSSSSSNNITGNTASGNDCGIDLSSSSSNTVTDNTANTNNDGIRLERSSNNIITDNTASNNANYDFYSLEDSYNNNIQDLTISSYPTTISFMYEHGIVIKAVAAPEPDPAGKRNIGKYVNVTNATEDSWILLNVSYSDADVTNVKEDSLRLYRWTGTEWGEITGSGVNPAKNYVYANLTSFSQIAVFGDPTIKPTPTPTPAPRRGGGGGGSSGPCDTDGDGYGDIDEIIMGTDPYDPCDPDPTCIACLASIGGRVLPKPAVKPQATPKLVPTPEPAPTSRPAPTPVPEPEKPGIPGFEAVFAVAGLLAVAYLMRRRKK